MQAENPVHFRSFAISSKVKNSRLYRLTARGIKIMGAIVRFHKTDFPHHHRDIVAAMAQGAS